MAKPVEHTTIKIGSALILASGIVPAVVSLYVAVAVGNTKTDQLQKQSDYTTATQDQMARDISEIKEQLGEIKGMLKSQRR